MWESQRDYLCKKIIGLTFKEYDEYLDSSMDNSSYASTISYSEYENIENIKPKSPKDVFKIPPDIQSIINRLNENLIPFNDNRCDSVIYNYELSKQQLKYIEIAYLSEGWFYASCQNISTCDGNKIKLCLSLTKTDMH